MVSTSSGKVIGVTWFTARHCVGLVVYYDTLTKEVKAYIGPGDKLGLIGDIRAIRDHGAKFPVVEAITITESLGDILIGKGEWKEIVKDTWSKLVNDKES